LKTVKLLLEEVSDVRMRRIYLFSDTFQRQISDNCCSFCYSCYFLFVAFATKFQIKQTS